MKHNGSVLFKTISENEFFESIIHYQQRLK